jgi:hypothetical protein
MRCDVNCIHLNHNKVQWWDLVNTIICDGSVKGVPSVRRSTKLSLFFVFSNQNRVCIRFFFLSHMSYMSHLSVSPRLYRPNYVL